MCLQWCHARRWLIDNDVPCADCDYGDPERLPPTWSCTSCTHLIARDGQAAICGLTRETLPLVGRCCHWRAELTPVEALALSVAELAPWLADGRDVAEVFAASPSAPPITFDPTGRVVVALDDLSIPLVYGVPASDWDMALGWGMDTPSDGGASLDDARLVAITAALEALEHGAPALEQALAHVAAFVGPDAMLELPEGWPAIVAQLIILGREMYGEHAAIANTLDSLEEACISL
jgi:hypothetical protein